jgi:hypothetical protein
LQHVLGECQRTFGECRLFAVDAQTWSTPGSQKLISRKQRDWIVELAFLRAFLALESFLEETFILYSIGQKAPKGRAPHRYTFPPSKKDASEWVKEGREYSSWAASNVNERALRYFRRGGPFTDPLRGSQTALDEARTIRNAIAHDSTSAQDKFESLARHKLGTLPMGLSVGGFLGTVVPNSNPPQSFLEWYLAKAELVASQIVPTK